MSSIIVQKISKSFGSHQVLRDFSHTFLNGKTHILLGSSGCGKSTLLKIILNQLAPDTGDVWVGDLSWQSLSQQKRSSIFGYVLQSAALFPHLTAWQNVALAGFAPKMRKAKMDERVRELASLVQLSEEHLSKYPFLLSGGQQQRVGLMRALFLDPPILLMDEPLAALDPIIRSELQFELQSIFKNLKKTVIFVTHDLREAALLGDDIVLMECGRIAQTGSFEDLTERPASVFVKNFISAQATPVKGPSRV